VSKVCGHSFSNETITEWLQSHTTCPICKSDLSSQDLSPNYSLREAVQQHLTSSQLMQSLPTTDPTILELLPQHVTQASEVLARAFLHDPWFEYFLGQNYNSIDTVAWFCGLMIKYAVAYGRTWAKMVEKADGTKIIGAAIWQPPYDAKVSFWGMMQTGFHAAPWKLGVGASWRAMGALTFTEKVRRELITEPHWYLFSVGVEPLFQNSGYGSSIMLPILKMADQSNLKCYVDTASKRSHNFFKRLGFEMVKEVPSDGSMPSFWCFVRNPKPLNKQQ